MALRDMLCENCQEYESAHLLYYEKYHKETGRLSLINPSFICENCKPLFLGCNALFETRPQLIPFEVIAKWDKRNYGLLSKKGYEFNIFANNAYFRKKIWRIKFLWKNGKQPDPKS